MVNIEIVRSLAIDIKNKFSKFEANKIFDLIETLNENPQKGKLLGVVGGLIIKELKYENFRFYFIADGFKLKFFSNDELINILLRFVRMSNKKYQHQTINEIKEILQKIGPDGFN